MACEVLAGAPGYSAGQPAQIKPLKNKQMRLPLCCVCTTSVHQVKVDLPTPRASLVLYQVAADISIATLNAEFLTPPGPARRTQLSGQPQAPQRIALWSSAFGDQKFAEPLPN